MGNRAFIWDVDGTLIDSYAVIVSSLQETLEELGLHSDREEIHRYVITYSVSAFIRKMTEETGQSFERIKERYSEISRRREAGIKEIPNAGETLRLSKERGDRNFIVTHRGNSTEEVLKRLDLLEYFDEIITSRHGFARKPAPDAVEYLMDKYGLKKEETYYVGDRNIDMECAANAGIKGILYLPEGGFCIPSGKETFIVKDLRTCLCL